ncbi:MAG TPA: AraC family transcriptional regulator [Cyclobacteriaceae bacterium]|nr:AraC family transcriptional regulator [Cyclobacteriaceae bacterium]
MTKTGQFAPFGFCLSGYPACHPPGGYTYHPPVLITVDKENYWRTNRISHVTYYCAFDNPMFAHMPIIQGILYGSVQRGAQLSDLCDCIGISVNDLGDSEFKVPFEQACLTWECCAHQTKDNLLGLHLGETSTMSVLGLVGNLMQSCPDLLSAFETMTHYIDLATDMIHFGIKQNAREVTLSYKPQTLWLKTKSISIRHSMEQSMAGTLHVFSLLAGKRVRPVQTIFNHKRGGDLAEYHRVFGTPVQFNGIGNHLVFKKEDLLTPILSHDKSLFAFFDKILREKKVTTHQSLSEQIKHLVRTEFQGHIPSIETVASRLNMTTRTLQRKLTAEGVSYRALVAEVHKKLAAQLFKLNSSASQISNLLGYSDPSAFRRAFKKWNDR